MRSAASLLRGGPTMVAVDNHTAHNASIARHRGGSASQIPEYASADAIAPSRCRVMPLVEILGARVVRRCVHFPSHDGLRDSVSRARRGPIRLTTRRGVRVALTRSRASRSSWRRDRCSTDVVLSAWSAARPVGQLSSCARATFCRVRRSAVFVGSAAQCGIRRMTCEERNTHYFVTGDLLII
jgi:hypothetical protein